MLAYDGWVISKRELIDQLTAAVECDPLIRPDTYPACRMMASRLVPAILRTLAKNFETRCPSPLNDVSRRSTQKTLYCFLKARKTNHS